MLIDEYHRFSPGFLHTLLSFRDRPQATERAFCGTVRTASTTDTHGTEHSFEQSMKGSDGFVEIGYVYKYAERKIVRGGNPWRIRQTGVYYQYDQSRSSSTLIVLSPRPNAEFKKRIQDTLKDSASRARIVSNPWVLHTMLVSTHLNSWRDYLEFFEDHLLRAVRRSPRLLSSKHANCAQDTKATGATIGEPLVTLTTLKDARAVEKHLMPLEAIFKSLQILLAELGTIEATSQKFQAVGGSSTHVLRVVLSELEAEALSYSENAKYISRRAQSVAQSVSDTLNLNFQGFAQGQSNNTLTLAKLARQDSVAIKALTLVTAFYLPFSFVAVSTYTNMRCDSEVSTNHEQTIFGMNLIAFDSESHRLLLSQHLWLYFVISVPLTILTLACWKWKMSKRRNDDELDDGHVDSGEKTEEV